MSVILVILIRLSRKTWGRFLNEAYLRRTYLQGRLHVLAGKVARTSVENAVHCEDGCSALRGRLQCTASEMGKTGTEIVSPILDKKREERHAPYGSQ